MKRSIIICLLVAGCLAATACQQANVDISEKESIDLIESESSVEKATETEAETAIKIEEVTEDTVVETEEFSAAGTSDADTISVRVLDDLAADGSLLTEQFYRSGMGSSLNFYVSGMDTDTNVLSCSFNGWNDEFQGYHTYIASVDIETEKGKVSYIIQPEISEEYLSDSEIAENASKISDENWQIAFVSTGDEIFVRLSGTGDLDGDYFTLDQMLSEPAILERNLSRADLYRYSAEELRLLRNEIYAVRGAKFQAEDLNEYFGKKIWYHGTIPTSEFPESLLSETERANLDLIKEMESMEGLLIDGVDYRAEYEALPDAPYLSLLDQFTETGIHVDMRQAKDMGFYYAVPGTIRVPVTLTQEQISALENGEEVELGESEYDGKTMMLSKIPESAPGALHYYYYEKGTEPDEFSIDANASPDVESGLYTVWYMSDDTIMKTVYEGDIYILKGAVRGDHVSLAWASKDQRELHIPENDEDYWNMEIWSNRLYHDGRGYITAVYCLGD